jgi:hypothetical protein
MFGVDCPAAIIAIAAIFVTAKWNFMEIHYF